MRLCYVVSVQFLIIFCSFPFLALLPAPGVIVFTSTIHLANTALSKWRKCGEGEGDGGTVNKLGPPRAEKEYQWVEKEKY